MKRGVINLVEVLILLLIFLGAAAFFASFYLSATRQEAQAVQKQTSSVNVLLNPPAKIIGVISIKNGTLINTTEDTSDDPNVVAFACVQETSGKGWWIVSSGIRYGTQGPIYSVLDQLGESVKVIMAVNNGDVANSTIIAKINGMKKNITDVSFTNGTSLLAICFDVDQGKIMNVYKFTDLSCDVDVLNQTVIDATQWCKNNVTSANDAHYRVYFLVPFEYTAPGRISIIPSPVLPKDIVNKGGTFSMLVQLAQDIKPNPSVMLNLKRSGSLTFDDIVNKWLEKGNYVVSGIGIFKASCESCTFYIG